MFKRSLVGGLLVGAVLMTGPVVQAKTAEASCSAAHSKTDWLVCRDPQVAEMDREMHGLFDRIQAETAGTDGETGKAIEPFAVEHRQWVADVRDKCPDVACLKAAYTARLADVKKRWAGALD